MATIHDIGTLIAQTPGISPGSEPLLGQVVLGETDLLVDPINQCLLPRPDSPFLPTLKMK